MIRIARSEMGQGTLTGLAQLVAEELECDWKKVTTESITPGQNLARKRVWGDMATGGSRGIRSSQDYVRRGGAAARMMLLQAAADEWKVPVGELTVADGVITHAASKRTTSYGKVAAAAAKLTPPDPKSIKLKDPKDWKIAGKPMKRLDTADKLNGSKVYAIDVKLPGMLHAAIKDCPVFGGKLVSFDEAKIAEHARRASSVVKVNDTAVAVVADTWWHAKTALDALPIVWDEGAERARRRARRSPSTSRRASTATDDQRRAQERRRARRRSPGAAKKVEAVYSTPFLVARLHGADELHGAALGRQGRGAGCRRRTPRRRSRRCRKRPACRSRKCEVYRHDLGGGFGRRGGTQDYVRQAVAIAKEFPGVPVKLIWSREEDHGARLLPADLAVQAVGRPRRRTATSSACTCACPASRSTPSSNPARHRRTARTCASCRATRRSPATRSSATPCRTC